MSHKTRTNKKYRNKKVDSSSSSSSEEDFCDSRDSCNRRCRPDDCPTPNITTAMCQRDCDPLLKVTTSTAISAQAIFTALSPDGRYALSLLSFFSGSPIAIPIDFQLYENDCGVLTPTQTRLPSDATGYATNTSVVSSATVSLDFKLAAAAYEYADVTDPNNPILLGYGFVDIFDPRDPKVNLMSFPLYVNGSPSSPSNTFVSGTVNTDYLGGISEDDRYLAIVLQTSSNTGAIQVYNLRNGNFIAEGQTVGFSNGAVFFDLCQSKDCDRDCKKKNKTKCVKRRFLAVGSVSQNPETGAFIAPSLLKIFEFKSNKLFEVASESASSLVFTINIPRGLCCPPETLISITTSGVIPGQQNLYTFPRPASLNGKMGGVTIYRFNGDRIREVAYQPIELGTVTTTGFTANGKYLAIAFGSSARSFQFTGFFQLFRVVNQDDCSVCLYPVDIPRPTSQALTTLPFSRDGKWLLVSGGIIRNFTFPADPNLGPINNVQLYQLAYPDCCPDQEDTSECIKQLACNSKKACKKDRC